MMQRLIAIIMAAALMPAAANADETPMTFEVSMPTEIREFPEPLAEGEEPGFAVRGTKGWAWSPRQYLEEIPWLARFNMNFLMNCYLSMYDVEEGDFQGGLALRATDRPFTNSNRWWEPLSEERRAEWEKVVRACQNYGIDFCFTMNPGLLTERPYDYECDEDFEALWQHYEWMQGLGVKWFSVSYDDIREGIDASGQSRLVNRLLERLRERDPEARMVFCPTRYHGDGTNDQDGYLATLKAEMHPDVYMFWTGERVVGPRISAEAARSYREAIGHRLIIWDNYPVNDANETIHLGPVTGRDAELAEICDGYMSNPMYAENQLNRLALATQADFAYNPRAYDPSRSITQAIALLGDTEQQRQVLVELVELYPGMLIFGKGVRYNPVRERISEFDEWRDAAMYIDSIEQIAARLGLAFPGRFQAELKALARDIKWLTLYYEEKFNRRF